MEVGTLYSDLVKKVQNREVISEELLGMLSLSEINQFTNFINSELSKLKQMSSEIKRCEYELWKVLDELQYLSPNDPNFDDVFNNFKNKYFIRKERVFNNKSVDESRIYFLSISNILSARRVELRTPRETKKLRKLKQDIYNATVLQREKEAEEAREAARAAEYAASLAEGRKKQTLQQAYANGDFIPVDESNQVYMPSITGKRLGAR